MNSGVPALNAAVQEASAFLPPLMSEINRCVVGQKYLVERLVIGLLANGHVLLEGVPGLAKTLSVKTLATALHVKFSRLQFTPDMLPADVVGTQIYNPAGGFTTRKGPVFANLVLADEINRAPAKVQSALLEAMQERQVTIGDQTYKLPEPFLVLATQNPIEQEGTYTLPEAQIDRFMVKLVVGYPTKQEELRIIDRMSGLGAVTEVKPATTPQDLLRMRALLDTIYLDDKVKGYIVDLVFATREPEQVGLAKLRPLILYGASPRASLALARASRARAFLEGRGFVTPQDVKAVGTMVLRHRVLTTYEAEAEGITSEQVLKQVFDTVRVP